MTISNNVYYSESEALVGEYRSDFFVIVVVAVVVAAATTGDLSCCFRLRF